MSMTSAEMQEHDRLYAELLEAANEASRHRLFRQAIATARQACQHVDGMMRYRERRECAEFSSLDCIELILRYAPLMFDSDSLAYLQEWLKYTRRVDKKTSQDLPGKVTDAVSLMWDAHKLWGYVESSPGVRQDQLRQLLGGDQQRWDWIAENWQHMGLVERLPVGTSYELSLVTRLGQVVNGKCLACGAVIQAPKAMFLDELTCWQCLRYRVFVLLG